MDEPRLTPDELERARWLVREFRDDLPQLQVAWIGDAPPVEQPPADAPAPGADVDDWLDWRAEEKKKRGGTWYRLDQIARWSGHTIAQLKYKSSLRKPRGTPKPATKNKKKLNKKVE